MSFRFQDIVNYLSEVMLPEILFRLYAKAKQLPYAKAKRLTETTQEHNRGKAS